MINQNENLPWKLIQQWNADGEIRHIPKYGISAVHKPRNTFSNEKVVIFRGNEMLVREKIGTKWSNIFNG
jgi:hypothetical protein